MSRPEIGTKPEFGIKDEPYRKLVVAGLKLRDAGRLREAADHFLRVRFTEGLTM